MERMVGKLEDLDAKHEALATRVRALEEALGEGGETILGIRNMPAPSTVHIEELPSTVHIEELETDSELAS